MRKNGPDLKMVTQTEYLAEISIYRWLLKRVAKGKSLRATDLHTLQELGAELEALAKEKENPRSLKSGTARNLTCLPRADLARYVFRISAQTISKWVLKEGMPRNDDGSYCVADCVEWAMERLENTEPGADDVDEALQRLTAFRKERALKAKMEREELEGKRFPRGEVTAAWCNR